uniref:AIPP2-like SPOC-like domain-containing protein n=1 Tax=Oryza meridionalis TaxID=40149 RepID=A0A0E0D268_9ORYZ
MAWSPWSKGNTESNPIRAQHHGVQIKGDLANNKTCSKQELDPGDEIDWTVCSINEMVCGICGSGHDQDRMAKCIRYCFPVVTYDVPDEWCCCECQKKSNWDQTPSQGTDIGRGSEMSPDNDIGMLVVINSSVEYARRPPPEIRWTGCFLVSNGSNCNPADFKAYFPSKVSSKVLNVIKSMPSIIELDILPRMDEWPKSFEINPPVYEDIGLFFFSTELDRNGKSQSHVMETSCNFVMRAYINNIKLLIYSSEVLPPDSQCVTDSMDN